MRRQISLTDTERSIYLFATTIFINPPPTLELTCTLPDVWRVHYVFFLPGVEGDNGFHQGHHRMPHGKQTAFEEDIRVPLMVRSPDAISRTITALVGNYDLAPTFLALANAEPLVTMDGKSMLPLIAPALASTTTVVPAGGGGGSYAVWNRSYTLQEGFYGCYPSVKQGDTCDAPPFDIAPSTPHQLPQPLPPLRAAAPAPHAAQCTFENDTNYKAHNIGDPVTASGPGECCTVCTANPACVLFTWNSRQARGQCTLKSKQGNANASPGTVSGRPGSAPPLPPPPPSPPTPTSAWSYRGLRWKDAEHDLSYTEWCNGETELYNMTSDPYQLHNVAKNVSSGVLQHLAATLASVADCEGETCPGRSSVPAADPNYVRQPFKCMWPAP